MTVRTTFPVFCCVSTYLVASITSSNGTTRSMTGRYSPASMSCLRNKTSCLVWRGGIWNRTLLAPFREGMSAKRRFTIPSVGRKTPPAFREPRLRLSECLSTASKMASYVWPFFVKSSFLVEPDQPDPAELRGEAQRLGCCAIGACVIGDRDLRREREIAVQVVMEPPDRRRKITLLVVDRDSDIDGGRAGVRSGERRNAHADKGRARG